MIIDLILDRKCGCSYSPKEFRRRVAEYGETWPEMAAPILEAMDNGTDGTVKAALCQYVIGNEYNPEICDYICSVRWAAGIEPGEVYEQFGVLWVVDRIYKVDPEIVKEFELWHDTRIESHVISAYSGYQGMREMKCAYTDEMSSNLWPVVQSRIA